MNQNKNLFLAPIPKHISIRNGTFDTTGKQYIKLEADDPALLIPAAKKTGLGWQVTASPNVPNGQAGLTIRLDRESSIKREGYTLSITSRGMEIVASDPAGAYYGACTLAQVLRQCKNAATDEGGGVPCLSISDWPDFAARGVMLDISRDKVPTMETLFHLVDLFSEWKINQFQLYTEHTFAYLAHPTVWENASPMTGEQIMTLDAYCKSRFIELVPNQNSFGHMERWLKHPKYNPLAEAPNGCETNYGFYPAYGLCPSDKRSLPFVRGLFGELLPHFSSRMVNVGCDETLDLGLGRSKKACKERGNGRVYLDFLLQIQRIVEDRGRTMQFWGDIIMQHPELISELPKNIIALEWGYEHDHPFVEHSAIFAESGVPFYVCPGTSTWNGLTGRTDNAVKNIASAAKNGLKNGSIGLLNTDWGNQGHHQPLSVSYLGFMAGAMAAWNSKADFNKVLPENLSLHAFGDTSGKVGQAFYDLGNIYLAFKAKWSVHWHMLFNESPDASVLESVRMSEFDELARRVEATAESFAGEQMSVSDADIVRAEFAHLMRLVPFASEIGKWRLGGDKPKSLQSRITSVKKSHEDIWLLRNRPGGLLDSSAKLLWATPDKLNQP